MNPNNLPIWLLLLNQPILVAIISSGFFGVIVACLGAFLQHRNWRKQEEISRQKTSQEKLFDKKAEIVRRIFFLTKMREQNIWNYYHEMNRQKEAVGGNNPEFQRLFALGAKEYRDKGQVLVAESNALLEEMKIYFDLEEDSEMIKSFLAIWSIWHKIQAKINSGSATEESINVESNEIETNRKLIQERLRQIIYRIGSTSKSDICFGQSNAATPQDTLMRTALEDSIFTGLTGVSEPAYPKVSQKGPS